MQQRIGKSVLGNSRGNSGDVDVGSQPYSDDSSGKRKRPKI